jgi:hypothetical protein
MTWSEIEFRPIAAVRKEREHWKRSAASRWIRSSAALGNCWTAQLGPGSFYCPGRSSQGPLTRLHGEVRGATTAECRARFAGRRSGPSPSIDPEPASSRTWEHPFFTSRPQPHPAPFSSMGGGGRKRPESNRVRVLVLTEDLALPKKKLTTLARSPVWLHS